MANQIAFFDKLKTLFSNNVIISNIGGKQYKILDVEKLQAHGNLATNRQFDRYNRLYMTSNNALNVGVLQQQMRLELFRTYELMDQYSLVAVALDEYASSCCTTNEFGNILTIKTPNERVHATLKNLFYDVLNVEFNLWPWIRSLCKYGDFYLHLDIMQKMGVVGCEPFSAYEIIREEGTDPEKPNYVRFKRDVSGLSNTRASYMPFSGRTFENYEMAHFRLYTDTNYLPYGRSLLEAGRKTWQALTMLEDAMLIHRIMRAPAKRVFSIDIGTIPPHEVDGYMEALINKMKKVPYVDPSTGEYNMKFNLQNMIEDFYLPVRGGESGTKIDTLEGMEYTGIDDVNYVREQLLAALRVPKAFLNFEEGVSGKASLAALDVRFATAIERIQRIIVGELSKIAIVHLYIQGFKDEEIADFSLQLTNPSKISEEENVALWQSKTDLAGALLEANLASKNWIYENIFHLPEDQYIAMKEEIVQDSKDKYRLTQIGEEGNDPVKSGQSFGTPHDIASLYKSDNKDEKADSNDLGGSEAGGQPGAGRPDEHKFYNTANHPSGRDPVGAKELRTKQEQLRKTKALLETFDIQKSKKSVLDEDSLIDDLSK